MKTILLLTTLSITSLLHSQIKWDFTTANPTSGVPSNVTASAISVVNNFGNPTFLNNATPSSVYPGATGGNNGQASIKPSLGTIDTSTHTFFSVTLTPATGFHIEITGITFGTRVTGTGPAAFAVYEFESGIGTGVFNGIIDNTTTSWFFKNSGAVSIVGALNTPVNIRIYGYNGSGSSGTANYKLDDLTITATANAVMPATLLDFYLQNNKYPVLKWHTADEINVRDFSVERSTDTKNFSSVAVLPAMNKAYNEYEFTDVNNYGFYRLKITDNNGKFTFSKIIKAGGNPAKQYIYKLPHQPILKIAGDVSEPVVRIFDSGGKELLRKKASNNEVDISCLPINKIYFAWINGKDHPVKVSFLNE